MSLGANRHLIGRPMANADFATPALLIDLDSFQANIATMADLTRRRGVDLRPHGKAHKSGRIGRMLIDAGAVGVC
ncbi:MAG: DSD1 family PLP-dependent enzyme, partial [Bauldia sp.]|nr:DSD1 family PLP-dependent enzyme [Bauldia sp.]